MKLNGPSLSKEFYSSRNLHKIQQRFRQEAKGEIEINSNEVILII